MSISLTVPLESNALRHTIKMLQGLENDLHTTPVLPEFCTEANAYATESIKTFKELGIEQGGASQVSTGYGQVVDATAMPIDPNVNYQPMSYSEIEEELEASAAYIDPSQAFATAQSDMPPPPPPPATVELDSEGMPWDGRIHTVARTKVANGTWKLTRNTPSELVASVKAEYLGNSVLPTTNNVSTVVQPVVPIGNVPPPPPPSTDTAPVDPTRVLMSDIAKGGFMPSEINAAIQKHGVQTLQHLRNHPDKFDAIRLELGL
jgi:hypothetical protein